MTKKKKESKPDGKAPKLERIKRPGKIRRLPEDLKIELDRRLEAGTFRSFRILSAWFAEKGYEISHTALSKYRLKFDRRLESIRLASEQARIVCEQFKDDDVNMQGALLRLVQTHLFQMLRDVKDEEIRTTGGTATEKIAPINITALPAACRDWCGRKRRIASWRSGREWRSRRRRRRWMRLVRRG